MNLTNKRFKSRAMRVLFHVLPSRTKRLVFISSLVGKIGGDEVVAEGEVGRGIRASVQQRLALCKDPEAMRLWATYTDKIWRSRPIEPLVCPIHLSEQQCEQKMRRTARQIVVMMPCWLVYGKTTQIVQDVCDILQRRSELQPT